MLTQTKLLGAENLDQCVDKTCTNDEVSNFIRTNFLALDLLEVLIYSVVFVVTVFFLFLPDPLLRGCGQRKALCTP